LHLLSYYGNGGTSADTVNTNEQLSVPSPTPGTWKIAVTAKALPYTPSQQYSIAIVSAGTVQV